MMDPATFKDRETWLAYLMGYHDGRTETEELFTTQKAPSGD